MSAAVLAGRYEVIRPLGHGAMAVVDLARDVELDRPVALKRLAENLARDEDLRRRFLREARLAARLSHPNVVRVFDIGVDRERPFIAMEYVDGETLAELVARRGRLPADEAAGLALQACAGLAAVHEAGLVHRDVKPQNLLLGRDGVLKLGDFGIALGEEGTRLTLAGTVLGTAGYLAPEQARGEQVTAAADIYAVGAVLCELLTGELPRQPQSLAELGSAGAFRPPDLSRKYGVPAALAAVVTDCLAERPDDRPPSAAALARRLAPLTSEAQTLRLPAEPELPATKILAPSARRGSSPWLGRLALGAAVVAAATIGLVVALVATSGGSPAKPRTTSPPKVAPPVFGPDAARDAQIFAAWLRSNSR
ncbi:MAG: serine/threonine-protein kinase [Gaiellaceae bacterium]